MNPNRSFTWPEFIQFAKNVEEMRRKWSKCEDHNKELETFIDRLNSEKNVLQRQVNELKYVSRPTDWLTLSRPGMNSLDQLFQIDAQSLLSWILS